jgi:hypothetical protein
MDGTAQARDRGLGRTRQIVLLVFHRVFVVVQEPSSNWPAVIES